MNWRRIPLLFITIIALAILISSGPIRSEDQTTPQEGTGGLPISVIQMDASAGGIPVELKCDPAVLTAPNILSKFHCTLTNNTGVGITAANVVWSVVFERDDGEFEDTRFHTIETVIDESIYDAERAIGSGRSSVVSSAGPTTYDGVVRRMSMRIDYVEFEDGTRLGTNQAAAQIVARIRSGASKFRDWIRVQYKNNGRSVDKVTKLLERDHPLPESILDSNERMGAEAYRRRLRKDFKTHGASALTSVLRSP